MSSDTALLKPSMRNRADTPYWAGLAAGELRFPQCMRCKTWLWPAQLRCKECGSRDVAWRAVAPCGLIYSWTRTHMPFLPAFADLVPYTTLLVEIPEAGEVRILGLHIGDESKLRIGASVVGSIAEPSHRNLDLHVMQWSIDD